MRLGIQRYAGSLESSWSVMMCLGTSCVRRAGPPAPEKHKGAIRRRLHAVVRLSSNVHTLISMSIKSEAQNSRYFLSRLMR